MPGMDTWTGTEALKRCVKILGSQNAVGDVVGRRQTTVSACIRRKAPVPAEWCRPLEVATTAKGERVSAADLRPDLFGSSVPAIPTKSILQASDHTEAAA